MRAVGSVTNDFHKVLGARLRVAPRRTSMNEANEEIFVEPVVVTEAARKRARKAQNKRDQRARDKAAVVEVAKLAELDKFGTREEWWEFNCSKLTAEEKIGFESHQDHVLQLADCMTGYTEQAVGIPGQPQPVYLPGTNQIACHRIPMIWDVSATGTTDQDFQETVSDVEEEVATYGLCGTAVLCIPRFWSAAEAGLREAIEQSERAKTKAYADKIGRKVPQHNATSILMKYGYITALPEVTYEAFRQKFLQPRFEYAREWVDLACATPGCTFKSAVSRSMQNMYTKSGVKHFCSVCLQRQAKANEESSPTVFSNVRKDRVEFTDRWGRNVGFDR